MESRTYIIGREGHIYINDPAVSKQHAEIQIINGEIFLRDLDSTNGTFLVKNQRLVPIKEGYVYDSAWQQSIYDTSFARDCGCFCGLI